MQRTSFGEMTCSIARTMDVAGEPWTPLIVRDIYLRLHRFDEIRQDLGISGKVLAGRLETLVANEILQRRPYQRNPVRHDYVLTEKGRELAVALMALMAWGDRWTAGGKGPPVRLRHETCGEFTTPVVTCSCCGEPLAADRVSAHPGPGGRVGPGTRLVGSRLITRAGSASGSG